MLICIPDMNSSIFPCLDDIYCVSGWMEAQKEECKSPCALQDFVPLWAAALLSPPPVPFHNHAKQGNRYCWPLDALGDLFIISPQICSQILQKT